MSEMIERATEAAIDAILDQGGTIDFRIQPVIHAIITTMREPTKDMVTAGHCYLVHYPEGGADPDECWKAMIDEIFLNTYAGLK